MVIAYQSHARGALSLEDQTNGECYWYNEDRTCIGNNCKVAAERKLFLDIRAGIAVRWAA